MRASQYCVCDAVWVFWLLRPKGKREFFFWGRRIKLPGIEARERENCTSAWWELERYFTLLELEPKLFIYAPNCGRIMAAVRFQRSTRESPPPPPLHQNSYAATRRDKFGKFSVAHPAPSLLFLHKFASNGHQSTWVSTGDCIVREGSRCKFMTIIYIL